MTFNERIRGAAVDAVGGIRWRSAARLGVGPTERVKDALDTDINAFNEKIVTADIAAVSLEH